MHLEDVLSTENSTDLFGGYLIYFATHHDDEIDRPISPSPPTYKVYLHAKEK